MSMDKLPIFQQALSQVKQELLRAQMYEAAKGLHVVPYGEERKATAHEVQCQDENGEPFTFVWFD